MVKGWRGGGGKGVVREQRHSGACPWQGSVGLKGVRVSTKMEEMKEEVDGRAEEVGKKESRRWMKREKKDVPNNSPTPHLSPCISPMSTHSR